MRVKKNVKQKIKINVGTIKVFRKKKRKTKKQLAAAWVKQTLAKLDAKMKRRIKRDPDYHFSKKYLDSFISRYKAGLI